MVAKANTDLSQNFNMSKFKGVTFTGADDNTSIQDLVALSKEYDYVEFGILLKKDDGQGTTPRWPSDGWIADLLDAKERNKYLELALHVSGPEAIEELIRPGSQLIHIAKKFDRVQMNMRWNIHDFKEIASTVEYLSDCSVPVITQFNDANSDLYKYLFYFRSHCLLIDFSGGNGRLPKHWPSPFEGISCGYAGGLNPENIATEFPKIYEAVNSVKDYDLEYWIDMESGVREMIGDKDVFSIRRCREVLQYLDKLF